MLLPKQNLNLIQGAPSVSNVAGKGMPGLPDDTIVWFTKKTTTGTGATLEAEAGSEDLTLVYTTSTDSYTLTDGEGNVVTFTRQAADPAGQYMRTSATPPGTGNTATYSGEKVTVDSQTVVRPTRLLAPLPGLSR